METELKMDFSNKVSISKVLTIFFVGLSISILLRYLLYLAGYPLAEFQSFRQTQTALSVLTMLHADSFTLVLPVAGRVSLPLEFPLFQYVVYLTIKAVGYFGIQSSLEVIALTGRLLSSLFLIITSIILLWGLRLSNINQKITLVVILSLLTSPNFIPINFVFLIDSFALLLATAAVFIYLSLYKGSYKSDTLYYFFVVFLALALLQKVTTVLCLYVFFGIHILISKVEGLRKFKLLLIYIVPAFIFLVWNLYSDLIKLESPLGMSLTSTALRIWNFGTFQDRFNLDWYYSVWDFLRPFSLFFYIQFSFIFLGYLVKVNSFNSSAKLLLIISLFWQFGTLFLFGNLFRHPYYIISLFSSFVIIYAIYMDAIIKKLNNEFCYGFLVFVAIFASLFNYNNIKSYKRNIDVEVGRHQSMYEAATYIYKNTNKNTIFVGENLDWSSFLPFYSDRTFIMATNILTKNLQNSANFNELVFSMGYSLNEVGGYVSCAERGDEVSLKYSPLSYSDEVFFGNDSFVCILRVTSL
jgi:hypothetical protein